MFIASGASRFKIPKGLYVLYKVLTYNPFGIFVSMDNLAINMQSLRDFSRTMTNLLLGYVSFKLA